MSAESSGRDRKFTPFENMGVLAEQFDVVIIDHFDALLADDKPLMDEELEMAWPELIGYANYIAMVLEDGSADANAAAYRATHFALLAASHMTACPVTMYVGDYYANSHDHTSMCDTIQRDTQEYMYDKPELAELVDYYLLELDPSYEYGDLVTTTAALVFMHVDEQLKQTFIEAEVAEFSADLPDAM